MEEVGIFPCTKEELEKVGIIPDCQGEPLDDKACLKEDNRAEKIYLPFVIAPRRQTYFMIRQAYFLLPENIRQKTAFLIADRLLQEPEAYIPYIQSRENVVFIGSFQGLDKGGRMLRLGEYKCHHASKGFIPRFEGSSPLNC